MANRFPLIVNSATKKIEELVSGDNIDLTGNGLVANSSLGTNGQYLKSNGVTVIWDNPGDVYLTASQTVTNKTFTSCVLSGSSNTFTNIPNAALVNSSITVNGVPISLGASVTTPDNNTTYTISAVDGGTAAQKIIRLTSGGNAGAGVTDDVTFVAGTNVTLSRTDDSITINSSYIDTDTITRIKGSSTGTFVTGDVSFLAASGTTTGGTNGVFTTTGATTITQSGNTVTVDSSYVNTVTKLRGGTGSTLNSGDFTILGSGATSVSQAGNNITLSSTDTVTRLQSAVGGTLTSGDITFAAATGSTTAGANGVNTVTGITSVSQSGSTITIDASYVDTVTRVKSTTGTNAFTSGDLTFAGSGATTVTQAGSTFTISSTDNDTTYSASSTGGLALSGTVFSLKNNANLTNNRVAKWDDTNNQFTNSIITDDGSTVTVAGNLTVTGTTTTVDSTTVVVADAEIELRKGNSIVGANGGIRLNRTTNGTGGVTSYTSLNWNETGGYWRVFDGTNNLRLVTETETQTLTNKTLTSPVMTSPTLGAAAATTINGLTITSASGNTLTIASSKTVTINNTLTFSGTDGSTIGFGSGGTVAYTTSKLSVFAATTSTELRGVISDETGSGSLVFGTSPTITTSLLTGSTSFDLLNSTATTINFGGAGTSINIGAATGNTTIRNNLVVNGNSTLGSASNDALTVNALTTFNNSDITISQVRVGRGPGSSDAIKDLNTVVGRSALNSNTTGTQNVAVGYEAGLAISSGASNTAIGYRALRASGIGSFNIAVGRDALLQITNGTHNIGIGTNTLEANLVGIGNVCIGRYAGAGATGSGNVLIGPATDENNTNQTHTPPNPTGDRQLVIATGTLTWIRGDNVGDVTLPYNLSVLGSQTFSGNLTLNGQTCTVNSTTFTVASKAFTIGNVSNRTFTATVQNNNNTITSVTPTTGLIPGMVVSISTGGISVPVGTQIVSITNNTIVLSSNVSGSTGTATFNAVGPSDTAADGGGLTLKGTTDKKITWSDTTDAWTSTEHFDLASTKQYRIGNVLIASSSQIGPSTGSFSLGGGVTSSSLTSVGTLSSLTISASTGAALTVTNTGTGDSFVVNDASGDTSPFKIDAAGDIYINNNIVDTTGSSGSNNQVLTKRNPSGVQWQNVSALADPNSVTNAGTSTDNAIARFDLATGKIIQNSGVTIDDSNNVVVPGNLTVDTNTLFVDATNNRVSTSGSLLVGTTPKTWTSGYNVLQVGSASLVGQSEQDGQTTNWSNNAYFDTNNNRWEYSFADQASQIAQSDGLIIFKTASTGTADAAISWTESARFNTSGNLAFPSGQGIDFSANANASGMTSELLDDYERGTWTPSLINTGTPSYSSASGEYVKIGSSVWLNFTMSWSGATAGGNTRIGGLPFAVTDSDTKVRGWATSDLTGTTVYTLSTTGLSNTAVYYHPALSEVNGTVRGSIQITTL